MSDNKTKVIWNSKKGRYENSDTGTFVSEGREARDMTLGDVGTSFAYGVGLGSAWMASKPLRRWGSEIHEDLKQKRADRQHIQKISKPFTGTDRQRLWNLHKLSKKGWAKKEGIKRGNAVWNLMSRGDKILSRHTGETKQMFHAFGIEEMKKEGKYQVKSLLTGSKADTLESKLVKTTTMKPKRRLTSTEKLFINSRNNPPETSKLYVKVEHPSDSNIAKYKKILPDPKNVLGKYGQLGRTKYRQAQNVEATKLATGKKKLLSKQSVRSRGGGGSPGGPGKWSILDRLKQRSSPWAWLSKKTF